MTEWISSIMRFSMPKSRNILTVALALLWTLTALTTSATTRLYPSDSPKPADPNFTYTKSAFECQPPDSMTIRLNTVVTLSDSTIGRPSIINGYPCAGWPENGPELIYRLDVATTLQLSAALTDSLHDLDLFLLSDCTTESCLIGANSSFTADLDPGIYYLIVDSVNTPDTFTLELSTRAQGIPLSICEPEGATVISCESDTTLITAENLFGQPDFIRQYPCGTSAKRAGENWYALEQGPGNQITVEVHNLAENLDVNLWLFAGCGPDAECLQFVDDNVANEGESLTWTNSDPSENVTVYLAVDAIRVIEPIPPATESFMMYDIDIQCQGSVPVAQTPFGSLKSLYR